MSSRTVLLLLLSLILVSCMPQYTLVSPGEHKVGNMSVRTGTSWNQAPTVHTGRIEGIVWTANGMALDRLMFFSGIEDGKGLFKGATAKEPLPVFKSDMLPFEVMELVVDSLTRLLGRESVVVEADNLTPKQYGENQGFSFDISYVNAEGLSSKGMAAAAVVDNKLYLIMFSATSVHYFDQYAAEAEAIMSSAEFGAGTGK
jgi:hypothetical protein